MTHRDVTSSITHPSLYIRDITDAHKVLEAVRLTLLPLIKRRMLAHERANLRSGNVFVWEESECEDSLIRWTDGRRWSQSKMRGECLYYEEKVELSEAERWAKASRRTLKPCEFDPQPALPKRKNRPSKVDGLLKQTYSVVVRLPDTPVHKKWHLVAYSSIRDSAELPVVEDYDYLRGIRVPADIFFSRHSDRLPLINGSVERFPAPLEAPGAYRPESRLTHDHSEPANIFYPQSLSNSRQRDAAETRIVLPAISSTQPPVTLPPLSSLGYLSTGGPPIPEWKHPPTAEKKNPHSRHAWSICSDDRRILNRFRVVI